MVDLRPNVYAHWKLNESSGVLVSDSSVHGRDGTTANMEDGDWVVGKLNNCLNFDGINEYVNCGNIAGFERTDAFSLECWFKTSYGVSTVIMSKFSLANTRGYMIYMRPDGEIRVSVATTSALKLIVGTGSAFYNDGLWHHIVFTKDTGYVPTSLHIYVDNIDKPLTTYYNMLTGTIITSVNFRIADYTSGAPFNGTLDEVVIYDKELSQEEVTFRWNGGAGTEEMQDIPAPPTAPSNPDPADTATGISYDQNLDWDCPDADTYDIYFGKSIPIPLVESDHPTSDYTIPYNLDSCTLYYWKIIAKNAGGETSGSQWSFTTGNEPPIIPHTPTPVYDATGQNLSLTLSWYCADANPNDSLVYDIYLGTVSPPPLILSNHGDTNYTVYGLDNDKTYYWKIVAKDDATCGTHDTASPIWKFKTKEEVTGGFESFDPRKAYRNQLVSLWNVNKDCDELEKCIYITDSKGDRVYLPMYLSEEIKSEQLPDLPFIELEIPPGHTTYEPHDVAASTRKVESYVLVHIYFTDTDNIDRTEFAKKIKDRLHDLTRYYQSITEGIVFMNIEDDGLEEETDGHRVVFHYIATLYCLWYDICTEL